MKTTHSIEKSNTQVQAKDSAITEISKASIYAFGASAAVIGCWATACLIAGMISSGGPIALAANFVKAVIGQ